MFIILLTLLALIIPLWIVRSFSPRFKIAIFSVILIHLIIMFAGHFWLVEKNGIPLVQDSSVDVVQYYEKTRVFLKFPPFCVTKSDVVAATNQGIHYGYYYLLALFATLTKHFVLAIRLFKTMLFFTALSGLLRVWRRNYGAGLSMMGFTCIALVSTHSIYYNFRNLKDGLLLSLFMVVMAAVDTLLRPRWPNQMYDDNIRFKNKRIVSNWTGFRSKFNALRVGNIDHIHRSGPRIRQIKRQEKYFFQRPQRSSLTVWKTIAGWCFVVFILWCMSTIRIYVPAILVASLVMHFFLGSNLTVPNRVSLLFLSVAIGFFLLRLAVFDKYLSFMDQYGLSIIYGVYGVFRAFITPIPWQHFQNILIPAHCFYLLFLLPFGFFSFFSRLKRNWSWHFFFLSGLMIVLGGVIDTSQDRKRIMIIPILVMWILSYLATVRGTHIDQRFQKEISFKGK